MRSRVLSNRVARLTVPAVAAGGLAVLGVVALTARPSFPPPHPHVAEILGAGGEFTRTYMAKAAVALGRPAMLIALVATSPGRRLVRSLTRWMSSGALGSAVAVASVLVVVDLVTLPLGWFGKHPGHPGLAWVAEWVILQAQTWALVALAAAGLSVAVRRLPSSWHLWATLVGAAMAAVIPLLAGIDPLAGDQRPLPVGPARFEVEQVLTRAGVGDLEPVLDDGPAADTLGAFVSGLGPARKVAISPTLLDFPPAQVGFVVAHEVAHRENLDVLRQVLGTATGLVLTLWVARRVLSSSWAGRRLDSRHGPQAMVLVLAVCAVAWTVATPLSNAASRHAEMAADWRALELTADPGSSIALQRQLVEAGGVEPSPPDWYAYWLATHPAPAERVGLAVRYAELNGIELTW